MLIKTLNLCKVKEVGNNFLVYSNVTDVNLSNVEVIDDNFIHFNIDIKKINVCKAKNIGNGFLKFNDLIKTFNAPMLTKVGRFFMANNYMLEEFVGFENLNKYNVGLYFMRHNKKFAL